MGLIIEKIGEVAALEHLAEECADLLFCANELNLDADFEQSKQKSVRAELREMGF